LIFYIIIKLRLTFQSRSRHNMIFSLIIRNIF
jgi:hypothetical protein